MAFAPRIYKNSLRIPVFDGGLNTKFSDVTMPLNQSPDLKNVEFDDFGAVATTPGYTEAVTAIASGVVYGLHSFYRSVGDRTLVAVCNNSAWYESAGSWSIISGATGSYANNVDVSIETVEDNAIFTDGYNPPHRYDGSDWYTVGVSAVASNTAAATASSNGTLTGSYKYAITGVNSRNTEGAYAVITSSSVSVSGNAVDITNIPEFPASAGVDTKYLYRNTAGASDVYYRVTALTAAQTSYTDNDSDSTLVTPMPLDNEPMPVCKYMTYYRGRIFAAGKASNPMRLYFSNADEIEVWETENFIDIGEGDGHPITGIESYGNAIIIHKNDGRGQGTIWLLYIADSTGTASPDNWYLTKSPSAYGGQSDKALAFFNNVLFFLNRNGGYAFTGQDIALNAAYSDVGQFGVDAMTYDIEPDIKGVPNAYIDRSAAINFDNKLYLAVPYGPSATKNNRIYVFDYVRASSETRNSGAWTYLDDIPANNFTIHEGELYFGSSEFDGKVYRFDSDLYNYNSGAIDSYYWTAAISGQESHRDFTKVFRHVFLTVSTPGDWDMTLTYRVDFDDTNDRTETINLNGGGSLWGTLVWDDGEWGGSLEKKKFRINLSGAVGKVIQFKFSTNTANQWFKVHELEMMYNLRSQR